MLIEQQTSLSDICDEMTTIRHLIHSKPELGFEEFETSTIVAKLLTEWGYQVTKGLGITGVVGTLRNGNGRSIALRADMDALPMQEITDLPYSSQNSKKMHACGHDGHTAMLLAAAKKLALSRNFKGTLYVFFQPAEEGLGGADKMVKDGLFEQFPCEAVFALHNIPGLAIGKFGFYSGPYMASADTVTIRLNGQGGHGATPHKTIDPVVACCSIGMALQTIVSRNVDPQKSAIISIGSIQAGSASNIIPQTAEMVLTVRAFDSDLRDLLEKRIKSLVSLQAESYGVKADIDYQRLYPVLINHAHETKLAREVAVSVFGEESIDNTIGPIGASEDFAFMLEKCPGSYLVIGNGNSASLHNSNYNFNDEAILYGASYWVHLVESFLIDQDKVEGQ